MSTDDRRETISDILEAVNADGSDWILEDLSDGGDKMLTRYRVNTRPFYVLESYSKTRRLIGFDILVPVSEKNSAIITAAALARYVDGNHSGAFMVDEVARAVEKLTEDAGAFSDLLESMAADPVSEDEFGEPKPRFTIKAASALQSIHQTIGRLKGALGI